MADTYKFKTPDDLELLEEVPETANAIVEVDGEMKRVPGSNLGGDSIPTAIFKLDAGDAASLSLNGGVAVASDTEDKARQTADPVYTATCENMTYDECKALLLAGELVRFRLCSSNGATAAINAMDISSGYANWGTAELIGAVFVSTLFLIAGGSSEEVTMYWGTNGVISSNSNDVVGK